MRTADMLVSLGLLVLAILTAWESLQLDIGWGLNGPQGGFFPFWLAVGLALCSVIILLQAVWQARQDVLQPFVKSGGWVPVLKVALPATAMVGLTALIGLHLAAALYLGFYMRWIGKHHWLLVLAVSILVPLCGYLIFDKWFLLPMPKGLWGERFGL
jgi:putative tricarboxylic transport membrane protein